MRIESDMTYLEFYKYLAIYNWFWVTPILLLSYIYVWNSYNYENKKIDKILNYLHVSTKIELLSTTDGRVAVADRVKLIRKGDKLYLPEKISKKLEENSKDIDLTIKSIREYLYEE